MARGSYQSPHLGTGDRGDRERPGLGAMGDVERFEDVVDVRPDGMGAQMQSDGNLAVGHDVGDEGQDQALLLRGPSVDPWWRKSVRTP